MICNRGSSIITDLGIREWLRVGETIGPKKILVEFVLLPGRAVLLLGYMFSAKGYCSVRKSARHARNPIMTFFYSLAFWVLLIAAWYMGHLQEGINILVVFIEQAVLILLQY